MQKPNHNNLAGSERLDPYDSEEHNPEKNTKIMILQQYIIYGAIAASVVAFGAGGYLGKTYGEDKATISYTKKLNEIEEANKKAIKEAVTKKETAEQLASNTTSELEKFKKTIVTQKDEKLNELQARIKRLTRSSGGVLYDPGAKPKATSRPATETGLPTGAAPSEPADTGRLSNEATRFLREDYARDAEITRQDLITQRAYGVEVYKKYMELVDKINKMNGYQTIP